MILIPLLLTAGLDMAVGETREQNEAAAAALHRRMDTNHDGYVTFAEVGAAALAMVGPQGQSVGPPADDRFARSQFELADTNHDGRISLEEATAGADQAFAEADTDDDGVLSTQERGAYSALAMAALQAEMATWRPLPCRPGAACATARSGSKLMGTASKSP